MLNTIRMAVIVGILGNNWDLSPFSYLLLFFQEYNIIFNNVTNRYVRKVYEVVWS